MSPGLPVVDFYEYTPETNVWVQKADFIDGHRQLSVNFSIGDKGYVCTGRSSETFRSNDVYEYNSLTDTWNKKNDFPGTPRINSLGFSINGKGYIVGGSGNNGKLNDVWEYDSESDSWSQKGNFPLSLTNSTAFVINNVAFVGTGYNTEGEGVSNIYRYDSENDLWIEIPQLPGSVRGQAISFSIGNTGYVGGGSILTTELNFFNDMYAFAFDNEIITTNLDIEKGNLEIILYPNPFHEYIHIGSNKLQETDVYVGIYNMQGAKVFEQKCKTNININLNLCPGLYVATIFNETFFQKTRIVKGQ